MDMQIVISSERFNIWFLPEKIYKSLENLYFWRVLKIEEKKLEDVLKKWRRDFGSSAAEEKNEIEVWKL